MVVFQSERWVIVYRVLDLGTTRLIEEAFVILPHCFIAFDPTDQLTKTQIVFIVFNYFYFGCAIDLHTFLTQL